MNDYVCKQGVGVVSLSTGEKIDTYPKFLEPFLDSGYRPRFVKVPQFLRVVEVYLENAYILLTESLTLGEKNKDSDQYKSNSLTLTGSLKQNSIPLYDVTNIPEGAVTLKGVSERFLSAKYSEIKSLILEHAPFAVDPSILDEDLWLKQVASFGGDSVILDLAPFKVKVLAESLVKGKGKQPVLALTPLEETVYATLLLKLYEMEANPALNSERFLHEERERVSERYINFLYDVMWQHFSLEPVSVAGPVTSEGDAQ